MSIFKCVSNVTMNTTVYLKFFLFFMGSVLSQVQQGGFKCDQIKCIVEYANVTFPFQCPYKNGYSMNYSRSGNDTWLPVEKWENAGNYYKSLEIKWSNNPLFIDANNKPCVVCNFGVCRGVSCSEKHNAICVYQIGDDVCDDYERICLEDEYTQEEFHPDCKFRSDRLADYFCKGKQNELKNFEINCQNWDRVFDRYPSPEIRVEFENDEENPRIKVNSTSPLKLMMINRRRYQCFGDDEHEENYMFSAIDDSSEDTYRTSIYTTIFWCEGYSYPDLTRVQSNILLRDEDLDFDIIFVVKLQANLNLSHNNISYEIKRNIMEEGVSARPMALLPSTSNKYNSFLFHINFYLWDKNDTLDLLDKVSESLNKSSFKYEYILNARYCLPVNTSQGAEIIFWPLTPLGQTVLTNRCNLSRTCEGTFKEGASWSPVKGVCNESVDKSKITDSLLNILNFSNSSIQATIELNKIISNASEVTPYDLHLVSKIIEDVSNSNEEYPLDVISDTMSKILDVNHENLSIAQNQFGATDNLLKSYDMTFNNSLHVTDVEYHLPNLIVKTFDLTTNDISTIGFQDGKVIVNEGCTKDDIIFCIFIDSKLLEELRRKSNSSVTMVTTVFRKDNLFNSNYKTQTTGWTPSIFIKNIGNLKFTNPLQLFYKAHRSGSCAFWEFGQYKEGEYKPVGWVGNETSSSLNDFKICQFTHLTHFALLVGYGDLDSTALDIITIIGCSLSLFGVLGIFFTAFYFNLWQNDDGLKILLNLSFTFILQMLFLGLQEIPNVGEDKFWCVFIGGFLHYTVLSQFCWMLIIGLLQYRRLVIVLVTPPKHLMFKASLFGWVPPIIFVTPFVASVPSSYIHQSYCYPTGLYFYLGVILPTSLILIINTCIFVTIFVSLWCKKTPKKTKISTSLVTQFKLVVFLFFLLGLTWFFGLFGRVARSEVLIYLFCITSTLQGIVLFIYYVVLNEKTRRYYGGLVHRGKYVVQSESTTKQTSVLN